MRQTILLIAFCTFSVLLNPLGAVAGKLDYGNRGRNLVGVTSGLSINYTMYCSDNPESRPNVWIVQNDRRYLVHESEWKDLTGSAHLAWAMNFDFDRFIANRVNLNDIAVSDNLFIDHVSNIDSNAKITNRDWHWCVGWNLSKSNIIKKPYDTKNVFFYMLYSPLDRLISFEITSDHLIYIKKALKAKHSGVRYNGIADRTYLADFYRDMVGPGFQMPAICAYDDTIRVPNGNDRGRPCVCIEREIDGTCKKETVHRQPTRLE